LTKAAIQVRGENAKKEQKQVKFKKEYEMDGHGNLNREKLMRTPRRPFNLDA